MLIDDAELYRAVLEGEIYRHATRPVDLLMVNDIASWAAVRDGNATGNPPAMAVVDSHTGGWGILLRRAMSETQVASILGRMLFGGFFWATVLNTPDKFLRHVVLHELAHVENDWRQEREDDCDAWRSIGLREFGNSGIRGQTLRYPLESGFSNNKIKLN